MEIYKDIYGFQAMGEIRTGKDVYVIDRERREIYCMNTMCVADFVKVVNSDNSNDRFSFYVVEETEETNE